VASSFIVPELDENPPLPISDSAKPYSNSYRELREHVQWDPLARYGGLNKASIDICNAKPVAPGYQTYPVFNRDGSINLSIFDPGQCTSALTCYSPDAMKTRIESLLSRYPNLRVFRGYSFLRVLKSNATTISGARFKNPSGAEADFNAIVTQVRFLQRMGWHRCLM
jgi:hypothetical protein